MKTRRWFLSVGLALSGLGVLWAAGLPATAGPSAGVSTTDLLPTRIILGLAADAAHSMPVTWRTVRLVTTPAAQIAVASAEPDLERTAKTIGGRGQPIDIGGGRTVGQYRVEFQNLQPAARYAYRVGDGQAWSEWNSFRTAASVPAPFRFIYLGDAQNEIRSIWSRTVRAAYAAAPDARLIVHAGDLVAEGYDDELWGEWCDGMGFISALVPSFATPGTHDMHRPPGSTRASEVLSVSPLWRAHLALPLNGPPGVPELQQQAYFVDYQGVRLVSLDVNAFAADEFAPSARDRVRKALVGWLRQILQANPNRWTIVIQHQAHYSIAKSRNYADMRGALGPLIDEFAVDLVLQGHDHAYGRTQKVAAGKVVSPNARGTIYAISVAGGKMYELTYAHRDLMATMLANRQLYQVIAIDGDRLRYDAYTVAGERIDAFELRKPVGATSIYVDARGR